MTISCDADLQNAILALKTQSNNTLRIFIKTVPSAPTEEDHQSSMVDRIEKKIQSASSLPLLTSDTLPISTQKDEEVGVIACEDDFGVKALSDSSDESSASEEEVFIPEVTAPVTGPGNIVTSTDPAVKETIATVNTSSVGTFPHCLDATGKTISSPAIENQDIDSSSQAIISPPPASMPSLFADFPSVTTLSPLMQKVMAAAAEASVLDSTTTAEASLSSQSSSLPHDSSQAPTSPLSTITTQNGLPQVVASTASSSVDAAKSPSSSSSFEETSSSVTAASNSRSTSFEEKFINKLEMLYAEAQDSLAAAAQGADALADNFNDVVRHTLPKVAPALNMAGTALQEALNTLRSAAVRAARTAVANVATSGNKSSPKPAPGNTPRGPEHAGVLCDGCDQRIFGHRFKCIHCYDFDLCSSCESRGIHHFHTMIRTCNPNARHYGLPLAVFSQLFGRERILTSSHIPGCHRHGWANAHPANLRSAPNSSDLEPMYRDHGEASFGNSELASSPQCREGNELGPNDHDHSHHHHHGHHDSRRGMTPNKETGKEEDGRTQEETVAICGGKECFDYRRLASAVASTFPGEVDHSADGSSASDIFAKDTTVSKVSNNVAAESMTYGETAAPSTTTRKGGPIPVISPIVASQSNISIGTSPDTEISDPHTANPMHELPSFTPTTVPSKQATVTTASPFTAYPHHPPSVRWPKEVALIRQMGVECETRLLDLLLDRHHGSLPAVFSDLFPQ